MLTSFFVLFSSVSLSAIVAAVDFDTAWSNPNFIPGRATFFGRDAWNLNIGSCGYGFVCPNRWTDELAHGYDLVAISDQSPLYGGSHRGSQCGRCLELKCRSAVIDDRYGVRFLRQGLCKTSGSVKVKITDTCDCNYPKNAASNARWCCGDWPHLDVSQWALEKLVDNPNRWGVFAIDYRPIGCKDALSNPAPTVPIVTSPFENQKPRDLDCSTQRSGTPGSNSESRSFTPSNAKPALVAKSNGSQKTLSRNQAFAKYREMNAPRRLYWQIVSYYNQFDEQMKKVADKGVANPLT